LTFGKRFLKIPAGIGKTDFPIRERRKQMKKFILCLLLCVFLATAGYGEKLSVKISLGGTYLLGGDYNKGITGFRDYELSVLGASETFVDSMKTLGLGYQFGIELLYNLNSKRATWAHR
jgi:hypothetical protein